MTRFVKPALMAALLPALAPMTTHARTWSAPESCEMFMTVQAKGCRVSNYYTCTTDQPGDQWRADFDQEGLFFRSRINSETEWVESISQGESGTTVQLLAPNPADRASFSELLSTGIDTFEFSLHRDNGFDTNVTGFDRLTGRSMTIDGVVLEETEFEAVETDASGNQVGRSRGNEFISRDMRMFFSGPGQTDLGDGQWLPIDGGPIDFIFPGEPGFASTRPLYDCEPLMTEAPGPSGSDLIWRARHGG